MLWLGPIGTYFLWKKWFINTGKFSGWGAMLSGLFYLLNLGTVQVFFAPLEAFAVFYGLLPWAILSIVNYLSKPSRKNLILMVVAQIIFSMIGFIPPQFIAYGMMVLALLIGYVGEKRRDVAEAFKRALTVGTILLVANLYWLAPVAYYSVYGATSYAEAKNNQVSTPDFQYMSEARGKWSDVALMRGFFIDSSDSVIKGEGKFFEIFEPWNNYLQGNIEWVGYGLFIVSMLGLLTLIVKKGQRSLSLSMLLVLGIGWVAIAQAEEPFTTVANLMHDIPVVGQAFRAAFTKFVGLLIFVYAIGFGYGIFAIYKALRKKLVVGVISVSIGVGGLIFYMWPMFKGNLIYERMKITMPSEYVQLMKFFKSQNKQGRIAYLPSAWMWGWQVHEWGYSGSGFLWYGIEQPILDRAFDVWSPYNEGFYGEFSTALYGGKSDQVRNVLDKYDVRYLLLDESVIAPGQDKEILRIDETKNIMEQLGAKQVFKEGFLTVWDLGSKGEQFVSVPSSYTLASGDTGKVRSDVIYGDIGHYVYSVSKSNSDTVSLVVYPFADLMKEEVKGVEYGEGEVAISYEETPPAFGVPTWPSATSPVEESPQLVISGWKVGEIVRINFENNEPLPAYSINGQDGPKFLGKEKPEEGKSYIVARVSEGDEWKEYLEERQFVLHGPTLQVEVSGESTVYDFWTEGKEKIENCDVLKRGSAGKITPSRSDLVGFEKDLQPTRSDLRLQGTKYVTDERGAACDYVSMKELDTRLSYLMRVQGENKEGRSLKFFLYNTGSKRNDIEYLLGKNRFDQNFGILPWSWDGFYSLNIETRSFGHRAENVASPVEVRWFPIEQIAGARIISTHGETPPASGVPTRDSLGSPVEESPQVQSSLRVTEVKNAGTWLYRVKVEGSGLLKLSQGYDEGWIAPPIKHVKVDGWANGWIVQGSGEITIFYWPQLLEYLGFGLLGMTIWLVIKK
jgi:hypothetical protein